MANEYGGHKIALCKDSNSINDYSATALTNQLL